jgi:hypothetical protein
MSRVLNARERNALERLRFDHRDFLIKGELPSGIGIRTLEGLVDLGLLEKGPGRFGETGYRITPDGWRAMYGKTYEEIMAQPEGVKTYPLKVWRWPPD